MKRTIVTLILLLFMIQVQLLAVRRRGDYFTRPQVGVQFGPYTPLFEVGEEVDSAIGFGAFTRIQIPRTPFKIGYDIMYHKHESMQNNALQLMPMYGSLQYRLPIDSPLNFQLRAGAGSTALWTEPDNMHRWDPTGMAGFEVSFPAGRIINLGLRLDYLLLYEKHLEGAEVNGHFLDASLCVFFNL
ncbi:MAG: outer membrane beta-barrel protein [Spirochaetota bacterium]